MKNNSLMNRFITSWAYIVLFALMVCGCSCQKEHEPDITTPKQVVKTNATKVYMHYMPWFQSKEHSGYWGSHWRMANKNPEIILPNGQRQIASHYYPLIGPYDSADPDLIDYHMLLMKYCGIDGVLIDWYGSFNVLDYGTNLANSNKAIEGIKKVGLQFSVVYEDFTTEEVANRKSITAIEAAQADMKYASDHYWSSENYIRFNEKPAMLTFGPRYLIKPADWTEVLSAVSTKPALMPLWYHTHRVGNENGEGEFGWIDFTNDLEDLNHFYTTPIQGIRIGSAFAGFHDYYVQGGWGQSYGFVDHQDSKVLDQTLARFTTAQLPYLQLVTWNDFGEGTMMEPTVEFEYLFLEKIQVFTGVGYTRTDLELIHTYYLKRKEHAQDLQKQAVLDDVFDALNDLDTAKATELLNTI